MCVCVCVCVYVCVVLSSVGDAHVERLVFLWASAAADSVPQGTRFSKVLISKELITETFGKVLIIETSEKGKRKC